MAMAVSELARASPGPAGVVRLVGLGATRATVAQRSAPPLSVSLCAGPLLAAALIGLQPSFQPSLQPAGQAERTHEQLHVGRGELSNEGPPTPAIWNKSTARHGRSAADSPRVRAAKTGLH